MFTQNIFQSRIEKLQNKIQIDQLILISSASDIIYFSNFSFLVPEEREAFLLITKKSVNLVHTSFAPINNYSYINYLSGSFPNELAEKLKKIVETEKILSVSIDDDTLFVSEMKAIKTKLPDLKLQNYDLNLIKDLRNFKGVEEIEAIKTASEITSKVMFEIKNKLKLGITESELKKIIQKLFEEQGVEELAFPTIVAFGSNSALPHHQPGTKKLESEMAVLIDMGAKWLGYCSDMTRTFWFGDKSPTKFKEIETVVHDAYKAAMDLLRGNAVGLDRDLDLTTVVKQELGENLKAGAYSKPRAKDIDNAARVLITNKGYGEEFIHTTGHGLGLSIHEQPSLNWKNISEIKPNMTITIEPGIYLEGEFGYRFENTVLVTENDANELTTNFKTS